jgi:hypothetical protein
MWLVLIIVLVALALALVWYAVGGAPVGPVRRRRVIVERPVERVVERPVTRRRRVIEEDAAPYDS